MSRRKLKNIHPADVCTEIKITMVTGGVTQSASFTKPYLIRGLLTDNDTTVGHFMKGFALKFVREQMAEYERLDELDKKKEKEDETP